MTIARIIVMIFQLLLMCTMCWTLGMKYPRLIKHRKITNIIFWVSIALGFILSAVQMVVTNLCYAQK